MNFTYRLIRDTDQTTARQASIAVDGAHIEVNQTSPLRYAYLFSTATEFKQRYAQRTLHNWASKRSGHSSRIN
jgi:hypothetical protein